MDSIAWLIDWSIDWFVERLIDGLLAAFLSVGSSQTDFLNWFCRELKEKAKRWDEKDVAKFKAEQTKLTEELRGLMKIRQKESELKTLKQQRDGMDARLKYAEKDRQEAVIFFSSYHFWMDYGVGRWSTTLASVRWFTDTFLVPCDCFMLSIHFFAERKFEGDGKANRITGKQGDYAGGKNFHWSRTKILRFKPSSEIQWTFFSSFFSSFSALVSALVSLVSLIFSFFTVRFIGTSESGGGESGEIGEEGAWRGAPVQHRGGRRVPGLLHGHRRGQYPPVRGAGAEWASGTGSEVAGLCQSSQQTRRTDYVSKVQAQLVDRLVSICFFLL